MVCPSEGGAYIQNGQGQSSGPIKAWASRLGRSAFMGSWTPGQRAHCHRPASREEQASSSPDQPGQLWIRMPQGTYPDFPNLPGPSRQWRTPSLEETPGPARQAGASNHEAPGAACPGVPVDPYSPQSQDRLGPTVLPPPNYPNDMEMADWPEPPKFFPVNPNCSWSYKDVARPPDAGTHFASCTFLLKNTSWIHVCNYEQRVKSPEARAVGGTKFLV
ncbi:uncharacterized protein LOC142023820 [Carettochelys insculpta]|uniref:uncharacterized protein LOC142023820 n=1 Tax=Carettochelys insculpta TaxID=44489 RepID=UPI003EBFBC0E